MPDVDHVLIADAARYYVVSVALWLIAVLLRITWRRVHACGGWAKIHKRQDSPHPFSTLGLAVLMFVAILRRFDDLGEPGDFYLWAVFTSVTLVLTGVLINVHFDLTPPWRRR